jgi:hypothetical protein
MSKESKSEQTLISTYLSETEKVIRTELPSGEREDIIAKLKQRWSFLHVRSHFDEFMASYKLKSLEAAEIFKVKRFMAEVFKDEQIALEPDEKSQTLTISVQTPEGKLEGQFTVEPQEEKAPKPTFLPFLACLSGDPGLAWVFGRVEALTEPEARIALNSVEAEFWETKKGLKLASQTKRTFEAFVENVPAGLLTNKGLKRHYKTFGIITAVDGDSSKAPSVDSSKGEAA